MLPKRLRNITRVTAMCPAAPQQTLPLVQLSTRKRSQTRERLLDFAYGAIIEKGFAATSIEELVEAAGITKSGFCYHFKDKRSEEHKSELQSLMRNTSPLYSQPPAPLFPYPTIFRSMLPHRPRNIPRVTAMCPASPQQTLPVVQLSTRKRSQTRERLLDFAYGAII